MQYGSSIICVFDVFIGKNFDKTQKWQERAGYLRWLECCAKGHGFNPHSGYQ